MCHTTQNLHDHHIFYNTANRRLSEKFGLKIWLCAAHHNMSDFGIHFDKDLDLKVKQMAQEVFEQDHSRDEFRQIFGKSYL